MLSHLFIKNYALIDDLQVDFDNGLTTITGETGAGKSIILGALSLVLGRRADYNVFKDTTQKAVVEAVFDLSKTNLYSFFEAQDLDYSPQTIIRREILPAGKSRAFINDTPVTLDILKSLTEQLIDIHAQSETGQISHTDFYFYLFDTLAGQSDLIATYQSQLKEYKEQIQKLQQLEINSKEAQKLYDYNLFSLNELTDMDLHSSMQKTMEDTLEELSHVEDIQEKTAFLMQRFLEEQFGVLPALMEIKSTFQRLSRYGHQYEQLEQRCESAKIELDDIHQELKDLSEQLETNPEQLEIVNNRLQRLYDLQKKHRVSDVDTLITIREDLQKKINEVEFADQHINEQKQRVLLLEKSLSEKAKQLHTQRQQVIPPLVNRLEEMLVGLGMSQARFSLDLQVIEEFSSSGSDKLQVLFSANKGSDFAPIQKVASGGEQSRIMLCIKAVLSESVRLPTIIFDEIDTGVSGEVALKTANIMSQMSRSMQVIAITHLPQVAAKGSAHLSVFKHVKEESAKTDIRQLNNEERVLEIAEMLGGKNPASSARIHASELLKTR